MDKQISKRALARSLGISRTTLYYVPKRPVKDAVTKRNTHPYLFHSDQGSEYTSNVCIEWIIKHKILPSHSPKSKPWKNGHQESFYDKFKLEFGKASRHDTIEKLIEAIGRYIHYYNTRRIHSSLKMPTRVFFEKEMKRLNPEL